jgi:2-keto-4-pentenoate hydratase
MIPSCHRVACGRDLQPARRPEGLRRIQIDTGFLPAQCLTQQGGGVSHAHDNSTVSPIARAFVEARRAGRSVKDYPGPEPVSLEAAYTVQDGAISAWPDRVAGWKLGRINAPHDTRFGAGRLAGPIFAHNISTAGLTPTAFPVIDGGFAAVEAEYVLEMAEDAPDREGWTAETVAPLVGRVLTGVEIAGSPFAGINDHGPAVTASDFGNNAGLIVGSEVADWRTRLTDLTCTMTIDGVIVGQGGAASIPGGPLDSLAFLLNLLHRRGRRLEAGQLISTGAATGVHDIRAGQRASADFGPDGSIECIAVPARERTV